jgi:hypothetical protein
MNFQTGRHLMLSIFLLFGEFSIKLLQIAESHGEPLQNFAKEHYAFVVHYKR